MKVSKCASQSDRDKSWCSYKVSMDISYDNTKSLACQALLTNNKQPVNKLYMLWAMGAFQQILSTALQIGSIQFAKPP